MNTSLAVTSTLAPWKQITIIVWKSSGPCYVIVFLPTLTLAVLNQPNCGAYYWWKIRHELALKVNVVFIDRIQSAPFQWIRRRSVPFQSLQSFVAFFAMTRPVMSYSKHCKCCESVCRLCVTRGTVTAQSNWRSAISTQSKTSNVLGLKTHHRALSFAAAAASTTDSLAAATPSVADADAPQQRITNDCCMRQT